MLWLDLVYKNVQLQRFPQTVHFKTFYRSGLLFGAGFLLKVYMSAYEERAFEFLIIIFSLLEFTKKKLCNCY